MALGKSVLVVTGLGFGVVKALEAFADVRSGGVHSTVPVHLVTHEELAATVEQLSRTLNDDIESRFEVQNRSVQSLRAMVARTDELLEQVLESLESTGLNA